MSQALEEASELLLLVWWPAAEVVEGSAEELVEVLKTVVAGIELELVLSVAPAAAAERKAAVADEDAPEVGTAGVGAVLVTGAACC